MFHKLIHKSIFYVSFVVFLGIRYALSAGQVVSFDFFGARSAQQNIVLGEDYIQQSSVDDAVIGTVIAHISFGENAYSSDQYVHDALELFEISQALVAVDVLDLITHADDPTQALASHFKHIETTVDKIKLTHDELRLLADTHFAEAQNCLEQKRAGDALFFDGANAGNQGNTADGLEQALSYAPCYITNRIYSNAYSYLADRVQLNYDILVKRQTLLEVNGEQLLQHTAYLETDLLDQLNTLKNQLNAINTVEYKSVQSIFDLNFPYDLENVPTFKKAFFDPEEVPDYLNPNISY